MPGERVVVVAVPRAAQPARSRSSPRRAGRPGAGSGCRARRSAPPQCVSARLLRPATHRLHAALGELVELGDLVPHECRRRASRHRLLRSAMPASVGHVAVEGREVVEAELRERGRGRTRAPAPASARPSRAGSARAVATASSTGQPGAQVRLLRRDADRAVVGVAGAHAEAADRLDRAVGDRDRVGARARAPWRSRRASRRPPVIDERDVAAPARSRWRRARASAGIVGTEMLSRKSSGAAPVPPPRPSRMM